MMILVLLLLLGVGAAVFLAGGRRTAAARQDQALGDARAEAARWYERLGGQMVTLRDDGSPAVGQALADAAERHQAAGAQLAQAATVVQFRLARETALEGLAYIRAARIALGLEPGPDLPATTAARSAGSIAEEAEILGDGQVYRVAPHATADTPYYYPGGYAAGRSMPAGYYSTPWWKTALAAGAGTVGGMLLFDTLFGGLGGFGHHHGGPFGGGGPGGPFGGGGPGGPF
jgi:hypothetical protein